MEDTHAVSSSSLLHLTMEQFKDKAVVKERRPSYYSIFAIVGFLVLAALWRSSGTHPAARYPHAWAYKIDQTSGEWNLEGNGAEHSGGMSQVALSQSYSSLEDDGADKHENWRSKWAYATFLAVKENDADDDEYFTAARTLTYQLLHNPSTRTKRRLPFLILAPPHIGERKVKILTDEGATVIRVDRVELETDWMPASEIRGTVEYSRIRVFELEEYDRILYIDSATLLTRCLDDIFDEDLVQHDMRTLSKIEAHWMEKKEKKWGLPEGYFMMAVGDTDKPNHPFPPKAHDWMTGAFFMLKPDKRMFAYYQDLIKHPGKFDMNRIPAGLFNWAHRKQGPMPWKAFKPGKWNVNHPGKQDVDGGAASMHTKFWDEANKGWLNPQLSDMWFRIQGQMEGFWNRQ